MYGELPVPTFTGMMQMGEHRGQGPAEFTRSRAGRVCPSPCWDISMNPTLVVQEPVADGAPSTCVSLFAPQASWLKSQGIKKGDCVAIYMPMVVELPIAMLACARIGAVHSVVFGGFSAEALSGGHQSNTCSQHPGRCATRSTPVASCWQALPAQCRNSHS